MTGLLGVRERPLTKYLNHKVRDGTASYVRIDGTQPA